MDNEDKTLEEQLAEIPGKYRWNNFDQHFPGQYQRTVANALSKSKDPRALALAKDELALQADLDKVIERLGYAPETVEQTVSEYNTKLHSLHQASMAVTRKELMRQGHGMTSGYCPEETQQLISYAREQSRTRAELDIYFEQFYYQMTLMGYSHEQLCGAEPPKA